MYTHASSSFPKVQPGQEIWKTTSLGVFVPPVRPQAIRKFPKKCHNLKLGSVEGRIELGKLEFIQYVWESLTESCSLSI